MRLLKAAGPGSRYSHPGYSWNRALSGSKHPSATVARAISQMITRRCSGFKLESAESAGTERSRQGSWIGLRFQRMPQINQESLAAIQPDLISGESILWAGQPNTRVIFHRVDVFMIPFSFLWGGFAIFWEAGVSGYWGSGQHSGGPWLFGMLWGVPFVLVGQYLIWGRFIYAAWKKKRAHYAVTNRRVIVVQNGWRRQMTSAYIDTLPTLTVEGGSHGFGTLRFAQAEPIWSGRQGWGAWDGMSIGSVPTFVDVEDVQSVHRLVSELREKARTAK